MTGRLCVYEVVLVLRARRSRNPAWLSRETNLRSAEGRVPDSLMLPARNFMKMVLPLLRGGGSIARLCTVITTYFFFLKGHNAHQRVRHSGEILKSVECSNSGERCEYRTWCMQYNFCRTLLHTL
jgi:hypothetical protein